MVAQTYGQRPSDIIGIDDPTTAYQFDVAVLATVSAAKDEPARASASAPQKYTVPTSLPVRRMAIPADGVW